MTASPPSDGVIDAPAIRMGTWSFVAALIVGFAVRLAWVVIATRTPTGAFNDAAQYLRMAGDLSHGKLATLANGRPTAFYAPGYPMLLVPVLLVGRVVGVGAAMSASIVNVVAGTVTVGGTGLLAQRWISTRARNPATWMMAIAPGHIFFTPTAHAETMFAALFVVGVVVITTLVDHQRSISTERRVGGLASKLVLFGLFVALCTEVRGPGMMLAAVPAMVLRAGGSPWRMVGRWTAPVLLGVIAGLLPWAITNGLHAGVWTPLSTQNATVLCVGHHPLADGGFPLTNMPLTMAVDCYRYSVFDDETLHLAPAGGVYGRPDEARWYRESSLRGLRWAVTNPVREVWLTKQKMVKAWTSEWDALPAGRNFTDFRWTGRATGPLNVAANTWLGLVEILAMLGLVFCKPCRDAAPIWGSAVLLTVTLVAGLSQPHFRHAAIPLLVVLASGPLALRTPSAARSASPPKRGTGRSRTLA